MLLDSKPNPDTQLNAMLQAFPDLLFTLDKDGVLLDYKGNEHVSTLFASADALIGQKLADVLPHEFGDKLREALKDLKSNKGPAAFECSNLQNGSMRWFETRLVRTAAGQIIVVVRDATRHKGAEEKIKAQLSRMAALRAIDLAIASSLDLHLALSVILSQVTAQLGVDAADILLLNSENILIYATGVGFRTEAMQSTNMRVGQGIAGEVVEKRETMHVPDLRARPGSLRTQGMQLEGFQAYFGVPLIAKGHVRGVLEVLHRSALRPDAEWLDFLQALAGQAAIAVENGLLFSELQKTNFELRLAYDTTIEGWSRALDLRDRDTEGHTQRVTHAAVRLARRLGMPEADVLQVRRGAMLHDIGKMAIADSVLMKRGPLTAEEWDEVRRHPRYAFELLHPIEYLGPALDIPHYHHERWDGSGYPDGLKGKEIPLAARLFAVIDVFDALTTSRPYRPGWDKRQARAYIIEQAGKHFDPEITAEFIRMLDATHTGDLTLPI